MAVICRRSDIISLDIQEDDFQVLNLTFECHTVYDTYTTHTAMRYKPAFIPTISSQQSSRFVFIGGEVDKRTYIAVVTQ